MDGGLRAAAGRPRAVGLAHVALANGQTETASTFADQALALDPENEAARELVESTQEKLAVTEPEVRRHETAV